MKAKIVKRWDLTLGSGMATAMTQDTAESKKKTAADTRMLEVYSMGALQ